MIEDVASELGCDKNSDNKGKGGEVLICLLAASGSSSRSIWAGNSVAQWSAWDPML